MAQINTRTKFRGSVDSRIGGRSDNQDTCGYADTPHGLLVVVCDGMGGGPGGKLASSVAVETIIKCVSGDTESTDRKALLAEAINIADRQLQQIQAEKPALSGMGTTVAALLINSQSAIVAHVGDSRVYQFRRGSKKYRTFDHSMVFEQVRRKILTEEQARLSPQSNVITRALGFGQGEKAEIAELPYEKGDRFMLASDGVWGVMPEKELVKIAGKTSNVDGAIESLFIKVEEIGAENGGTHDNFTAAFVETSNNSNLKEKMSTRDRNIFMGLLVVCGFSLLLNIVQACSSRGTASAGKAKIEASARKQMAKDSATIALYSDSIQKLNNRLNELDKEKAGLEGEKKGLAKAVETVAKQQPPQPDETQTDGDKQAVIGKLDEIIKKIEELQSGKARNKSAAIKGISSRINSLKEKLSHYGLDTSFMNTCVKKIGESKTKADLESSCKKAIGEINALKGKIANHQ